MRNRPKFVIKTIVALGVASICPNLIGQTVSTPIVGFYKKNFPAGGSLQTSGFVKPVAFSGAATSISGDVISRTSAGWTAGQFASLDGLPTHYVEVISGPRAGYTYDVLSNTTSSITVSSADAGNAGGTASFKIVPHTKVSDIFNGATNLSDHNDQISIYNADGSNTNLLRDSSSPSGWIDATSGSAADAVIYPNQGFVLTTASSGQISVTGTVKETPTVIPLYAGKVNIVSLSNPGDPLKDVQNVNLGQSLAAYDSQVVTYKVNGSLLQDTALLWAGSSDGGFLDATSGSPATGVNIRGIEPVIVSVTSDTVWICQPPLSQ
jgi:uncharacterized protein (TIGR02597 family)